VLNIAKTNVLRLKPKTTPHVPLYIFYKDNVIDEVKSTKVLGMHTENDMNWKKHAEQILPKLSASCTLIKRLIHTLNPDILRMVYFAYFHSVLQHGIIFLENSTHAHRVFKLQERVVRLMSGLEPRSSYRNLFRKLNILPIECQYILFLMLLMLIKRVSH
jgi:hypothetical protein